MQLCPSFLPKKQFYKLVLIRLMDIRLLKMQRCVHPSFLPSTSKSQQMPKRGHYKLVLVRSSADGISLSENADVPFHSPKTDKCPRESSINYFLFTPCLIVFRFWMSIWLMKMQARASTCKGLHKSKRENYKLVHIPSSFGRIKGQWL